MSSRIATARTTSAARNLALPRLGHAHDNPRVPSILGLAAAIALVTACGDPLGSPDLIQNARVLGAKVERVADPTESTVAPSEAATLRWLVVGPNGPPAIGWSVSLCVAAPVVRALPICASPDFAHFESNEVSVAEPQIELVLPDEAVLQGAEQVTANAAFCQSGTPIGEMGTGDPTLTRCPDPGETPLLATMGISVARNGTVNHQPSFAGGSANLDAVLWDPWSEPTDDTADCSSLGNAIPTLRADSAKHAIDWSFPFDQSEPLATTTAHSQERETIQLSQYVTAGHLDRIFSDVDGSTPTVALNWQAPSTAPANGLLVRFYFVLRDGRGGIDWTSRAVCVLP